MLCYVLVPPWRGPRGAAQKKFLCPAAFCIGTSIKVGLARSAFPTAATSSYRTGQSGVAAATQERIKEGKYCEAAAAKGIRFIPFAMETYGKLGTKALRLLRTLGQDLADSNQPSALGVGALDPLHLHGCAGTPVFHSQRHGHHKRPQSSTMAGERGLFKCYAPVVLGHDRRCRAPQGLRIGCVVLPSAAAVVPATATFFLGTVYQLYTI